MEIFISLISEVWYESSPSKRTNIGFSYNNRWHLKHCKCRKHFAVINIVAWLQKASNCTRFLCFKYSSTASCDTFPRSPTSANIFCCLLIHTGSSKNIKSIKPIEYRKLFLICQRGLFFLKHVCLSDLLTVYVT